MHVPPVRDYSLLMVLPSLTARLLAAPILQPSIFGTVCEVGIRVPNSMYQQVVCCPRVVDGLARNVLPFSVALDGSARWRSRSVASDTLHSLLMPQDSRYGTDRV